MLFIWNIPAFILSLHIGYNYIITALLFFGIPAGYLSWQNKKLAKSVTSIALTFIIPLTFIADYLAHADGAWQNISVTGVKLLGVYPIEDFLWGFLYFYYVIIFYEYFFNGTLQKIRKLNNIYSTKIPLISVAVFTLFILLFSNKIRVPYFYTLWLLSCFVVIPILIYFKRREIIKDSLKITLVSWFAGGLYEYAAHLMHNWVFPGKHFIGHIQILGANFPVEELMFLLLNVPAMIAYYELSQGT